MAITLYRENKVCDCDPSQLDLMKKAGWSTEKPQAKTEQPKAEAAKPAAKPAAKS